LSSDDPPVKGVLEAVGDMWIFRSHPWKSTGKLTSSCRQLPLGAALSYTTTSPENGFDDIGKCHLPRIPRAHGVSPPSFPEMRTCSCELSTVRRTTHCHFRGNTPYRSQCRSIGFFEPSRSMIDARQTETKINQTSRSQNPRAQRCVPRKVRFETLVAQFWRSSSKGIWSQA
jgi:hypothetical protein